ncbi:MAG: Pr6Pr family membrane protein [Anaerolineae bacterium]|jgi:hypothetical protein|nr:Pr6Pr family membrane protein [Anaerolineae bacterium]
MNYHNKLSRFLRTILGISLLLYLFSNEKMDYWFPYYTFHTNVFVGLWYVLSGLFPGKEKPSFWVKDGVKGAVTTYITITGLVYCTLLIHIEIAYVGYLPITSIITHMVVPVLMIADYLFFPIVSKPEWKQLPLWLTYPILYALFTVIRGAIINFYPYPFIDPNQVTTTLRLVANYVGLVSLHLAFAAFYLAIARRKWNHRQVQ